MLLQSVLFQALAASLVLASDTPRTNKRNRRTLQELDHENLFLPVVVLNAQTSSNKRTFIDGYAGLGPQQAELLGKVGDLPGVAALPVSSVASVVGADVPSGLPTTLLPTLTSLPTLSALLPRDLPALPTSALAPFLALTSAIPALPLVGGLISALPTLPIIGSGLPLPTDVLPIPIPALPVPFLFARQLGAIPSIPVPTEVGVPSIPTAVEIPAIPTDLALPSQLSSIVVQVSANVALPNDLLTALPTPTALPALPLSVRRRQLGDLGALPLPLPLALPTALTGLVPSGIAPDLPALALPTGLPTALPSIPMLPAPIEGALATVTSIIGGIKTILPDFFFPLYIGGAEEAVYEIAPLEDTRAPFNSGSWFAHLRIKYEEVSYRLMWNGVDARVLSNIDYLSIQLGSTENSEEYPWGGLVEITPYDLTRRPRSGSSKQEIYQFNDTARTYGTAVRIECRLKQSPESAPTRDTGRTLAAQNSFLLDSSGALDVRFVFPRDGGRELWASSAVLATVSPYLKKLFDWRAPEITTPAHPTSLDTPFLRSALTFDDSDDDDALANPPSRVPVPCKHPHHTVEVTEFSYITYRATLSWILSHHIEFRPHATTNVNSPTPAPQKHSSTLPLPASPKSVYRLAHLLEIRELQALALEAIRSQVTVATVVADLFSETSGKYPAVLDVLCQFMVEHREEMKEAGCWDEIVGMVKATEWGAEVLKKAFVGMF
ncbi:hypothetical protein RQP46_002291 [Phenoliferia psychrophenolica]